MIITLGLTQSPAVYPEYIGWYDTTFDKKKILQEFFMYSRWNSSLNHYGRVYAWRV